MDRRCAQRQRRFANARKTAAAETAAVDAAAAQIAVSTSCRRRCGQLLLFHRIAGLFAALYVNANEKGDIQGGQHANQTDGQYGGDG